MNDDKKPPIPLKNNYDKHYSDSSFWDKIKSFAAKAGYKLIYNALLLYYAMQSPTIPAKDKAIIVAVLGYFILPTDLIPDLIAALGFTDDELIEVFDVNASDVNDVVRRIEEGDR